LKMKSFTGKIQEMRALADVKIFLRLNFLIK